MTRTLLTLMVSASACFGFAGRPVQRPLLGHWPEAFGTASAKKQPKHNASVSLTVDKSKTVAHPPRRTAVPISHLVISSQSPVLVSAAYLRMREASGRRIGQAMETARRWNAAGRSDFAYNLLKETMASEMDGDGVYILLLDTEFRLGYDREAYQLLAGRGRLFQSQDLLRASLAAAKAGEVYQGQRDYVLNCLGGASDHANIRAAAPQGESPHEIAVASCIAIGTEEATHNNEDSARWYFEQAYFYGPPNPYVNIVLTRFIYLKDPQRALRLAKEAWQMPNAADFESDIWDARGYAIDGLKRKGLPIPPPAFAGLDGKTQITWGDENVLGLVRKTDH